MAKQQKTKCGYRDCLKEIPAQYGKPGVSLSRHDNRTLVCSDCGRREAFGERPKSLLVQMSAALH